LETCLTTSPRVDGGVDPPLFGGGVRKGRAGVRCPALAT
jgi:hypothetical protein